jgi:type I restriction enzyme, S subunit
MAAGYGMSALKIFNLLYGLMILEKSNMLEKVEGLKMPECKFSYLLEIANDRKDDYNDEKLAKIIFKDVIDSIYYSKISDFLYYEIPTVIKSKVFVYLIKEIASISDIENKFNVQLSGKIYEYFIGRDKEAISELGAYFTDRHIVNYTINEATPALNEDGSIPTMIDMFGGSGGFTTGYVNYMIEKYPNINWKTEINKIHHYDINEDVIKSAALEIFCATKEIPDTNNNIRFKNAFVDEFGGERFKFIFSNPPYGGDKNEKSSIQERRIKIKKYIEDLLKVTTDKDVRIKLESQLKNIKIEELQEKAEADKSKVSVDNSSNRIRKFADLNKIKGNDKEGTSLILLMEMVDIGGTVAGVLKEGVFFDKKYKDIRECLIKKFNVRKIISVPADQFENTSTKTSIVIFDNTEEKTNNVDFYDLIVEKYSEDKFEEINNNICLVQNKGDIVGVSHVLVANANMDDIIKNGNWSLAAKDYKLKTMTPNDGYKLVELGELCNIETGKDIINNIIGNIPIYGGGGVSGYTNTYNRVENTLIISRAGISPHCVRLVNEKFYLNGNAFSIQIKNNNSNLKDYINYYMLSDITQIHIYNNYACGSVQKVLSSGRLVKFMIPIPTDANKIVEWSDKISVVYNELNIQKELLIKTDNYLQEKIKNITENEDCASVGFCELLEFAKKQNKYKASDGNSTGKYKFYVSSQIKILFRDDYEFKEKHILIGGGGNASLHIDSMFSTSNDVHVLTNKQKNNSLLSYIYYYLKINMNLIEETFRGSVIKHSSIEALSKINIKIPKNIELINNFKTDFDNIDLYKTNIELLNENFNNLIKQLAAEAIKSY